MSEDAMQLDDRVVVGELRVTKADSGERQRAITLELNRMSLRRRVPLSHRANTTTTR
jgi:hypothetical protein